MRYLGLLVGMYFRPPAKAILANLPAGTKLKLEPEVDNPWDFNAVKVLIDSTIIPSSSELAEALVAFGMELDDLDQQPEWHLGYLAKEGNKDLKELPECKTNAEILEAMDGCMGYWEAELTFSGSGKPLVEFHCREGNLYNVA